MTRLHHRTCAITGATGFLGSHLMAMLLQKGYDVVVLGRRAQTAGLEERLERLLDWFRIGDLSPRTEAFEADLLKPGLGLGPEDYGRICAARPVIIHCASDTRFSEHNRGSSLDANFHALRGIIGLAKDSGSPFLYHISTAYVTGRCACTVHESPVTGHIFSNVYEETKGAAEKEVTRLCTAWSVPYAIVRPSVVYGDSETGRSNRFNALYYHVRSLQIIRDIYAADIRERSGSRSAGLGIHFGDDGILHLPLRIFLDDVGRVNLVPVDHFTAVMEKLLENARPGRIYHVTDDNPKEAGKLAAYSERFLNMKGIRVIYGRVNGDVTLNPPEEVFNKLIGPYRPYLCDVRRFDRTNTLQATGGLTAPEMTYEVFERCMRYAVGVSWGKMAPTFT